MRAMKNRLHKGLECTLSVLCAGFLALSFGGCAGPNYAGLPPTPESRYNTYYGPYYYPYFPYYSYYGGAYYYGE